ncbi:MAG: RNA methyltransferase [Opitutaceae bacterium]|nr:RNA methyltransferase [Opitutaceae bacterium]
MALTKAELTRLRSLRHKKRREETGLFVIEGEKVVRELVEDGFPLVEIYATDSGEFDASKVPVRGISREEMGRISHFPTPSSVLAVGRLRSVALMEGEISTGLTLALDGIQDAGNVGTLLRTADWFGFDRVLLSPECADLHSQKVINASMGSFSRVRCVTTDLADALSGVGGPCRVPVYGCDLQGTPVMDLRPTRDAVVVVGSEGRGLSRAVESCLTERVTIPRFGSAESLNAAVAAGIVCARLRMGQG